MMEGKIQQAGDTSKRLRRLYELALTVAGDPVEVFDQIVKIIAELFKVRVALIERLEGDKIITLSMYLDGKILHEGVFDLEGTPCANVREVKEFCSFNNAAEQFPRDKFLTDYGLNAYVGTPVVSSAGEVIAVINAMNDEPLYLNEDDQLFLNALASRVRLELERKEQEEEAGFIRTLLDILREISGIRKLGETLQVIAERTKELLGADVVALATTDDSMGTTSWKAIAGYRTDAFMRASFSPGQGIAGKTIDARKTVVLNGVAERPEYPREEFPIHVAEGIRNSIGVPMFTGEKIVGVLIAGYRSDRTFTARQIETAETIAAQTSIIIDNAQLFTELGNANRLLLEANRLKTEMIAELSTPVIPVWDRVLLAPLVGTLNADRAQKLTEAILDRASGGKSQVVIIDITGVRALDSDAAQHLIGTAAAIQVLGAHCIITGIGSSVAQTLVNLGVSFEGIKTKRRLSDALHLALEILRDHSG